MKKAILVYFLFTSVIVSAGTFGSLNDSLRNLLKTCPKDTNRVVILLQIANNASSNEEAMRCAKESYEISLKLKYQTGIRRSIHTIANVHYNQGENSKALKFYLKEKDFLEKSNQSEKIGGVFNGIGNVYAAQNKLDKALENYLLAVESFKKLGIKDGKSYANTYTNIGTIYQERKNFEKATEYYNRVVEIFKTEGDDPYLLGNIYSSIALMREEENKVNEAISFYALAELEYKKIEMSQRIADVEVNLGNLYFKRNEFAKSVSYYNNAFKIIQGRRVFNVERSIHDGLSKAYFEMGNFKESTIELRELMRVKDSMLNESNNKALVEMETQFETEKKDKAILLKDARIEKQNAENKQFKTVRNAFIVGFGLMVLLAFFIYRSFRLKKKANIEISKQKLIIEEKQKDIVASIHYAKRIQQALLPSGRQIDKILEKYRDK